MNILKNTSRTVIKCYDILDVSLAGGIKDFTDGKYFGDPSLSYEVAQKNQAEWLLDQIKCKKGDRILDIGCGNGRILEAAKKRGARATGITVSEIQVKRTREKGLDTYLMDYRNIPDNWNNRYDGLIANGSVEHFVQIPDAINGKQAEIYRKMYAICHRILKPEGRFATTIIHFSQSLDPREIAKGSKTHPRGSDKFHFTKILLENFGGWYPIAGQLQKCAQGYFILKNHEDGTDDYHWTSEYWLKQLKNRIPKNPKIWLALIKKLIRYPKETIRMLDTLIVSQSWMWQFRPGDNGDTPTKLFRDTWKRVGFDIKN